MKLAAYLRVSTDQQADHGQGLDVQRAAIAAWAESHDHTVVLWASDEGQSGSNGLDKRIGLFSALAAVEDHTAGGLIVAKLDRLARDLALQELLLSRVWAADGAVYSTVDAETEMLDNPNDPTRTLTRQLLGAIAQYERALIAYRLRGGKLLRKARGGYVGGSVPYGFDRAADPADETRCILVPNETEQQQIVMMRRLRDSGASLAAIVAELDAGGVPTKTGARWYPATVSAILNRSQEVSRPLYSRNPSGSQDVRNSQALER